MPSSRALIHIFAIFTMALWLGGFTFYSAFVIPALHAALGNLEAGAITRHVAATLNQVGVLTLAVWWILGLTERRHNPAKAQRVWFFLLTTSTLILLFLFATHRVLAHRLDVGDLRGFYPRHQVYLIACTAQWFANVGLLALSVARWSQERAPMIDPDQT